MPALSKVESKLETPEGAPALVSVRVALENAEKLHQGFADSFLKNLVVGVEAYVVFCGCVCLCSLGYWLCRL
jgi:hypothetical protein